MNGVSVGLMGEVVMSLAKRFGDRALSAEQMNQLIQLLSEVESIYRNATVIEEKPKTKGRK